LKRKHVDSVDLAALNVEDRQEPVPAQAGPSDIRQLVHRLNIDQFRKHLLQWIVKERLPFAVVGSNEWKVLLQDISPGIGPYLCTGAAIRQWVIDDYSKAVLKIKQVLAVARSRIHISFDV
jgi:hypothetical protein